MHYISASQVHQHFDYQEFIPFLKSFLTKNITTPDRSHFQIPLTKASDATLLTMPAWAVEEYIGVKIVSVFPDNTDLPTINGSYLLIDGKSGKICCIIDGLALTVKRTASVSALASQMLFSKQDITYLILGTGNLCHEFIKAHSSIRQLRKVMIWGRNFEKATNKAKHFTYNNITPIAIADKSKALPQADLISGATLSDTPLIFGKKLKTAVYLDLVGSFKKGSREADDDCLKDAAIYVDTYKAADESGDLYMPLKNGVLKKSDILADLTALCKSNTIVNPAPSPKIYFKSVGFAAPDLAAAVYFYEKIIKE